MLNWCFYIFSLFLIISASMVVISKNPVFSLLFLVSSFLFSSFLMFLLECEFLALLFIVIYVGAIAVLFLFAVMMLEIKHNDLYRNVVKYLPLGVFFGIALISPVLYEISTNFPSVFYTSFYTNKYQNWYDFIDSTTDVEVYGQVLYSYFVLQLLIVGLILLVVLIGVVYLTNTYSVENSHFEQSAFKQLARKSKFGTKFKNN